MNINNLASFDFETVPDLKLIRKKYGSKYDNVGDLEMVSDVRASYGTDFLPTIYHEIVSISISYLDIDIKNISQSTFTVLTVQGETESAIIANFLSFLDTKKPNIISWNGKNFDLQVLNYRMLKHMLSSKLLHSVDGEFKYDNYTNRYHNRHIDLMDKLSMHSWSSNANLETMCISLGLPGKFSFNRDQLFEDWYAGKQQEIDEYCETDTLNVMIIYIKYLYISSVITEIQYKMIEAFVSLSLQKSGKSHLIEFDSKWEK